MRASDEVEQSSEDEEGFLIQKIKAEPKDFHLRVRFLLFYMPMLIKMI